MAARDLNNSNWQRWYKIIAGEESPLVQGHAIFAFRLFALVLQYITLRWTHNAWLVRSPDDFPECPMLPLMSWDWIPQFNVYGLLIGSLILSLFLARVGFLLQSVVLFCAIIADQTRLQPEVISPLILLWGTLPSHTLRTIARVHLGTMWFYAGLHKAFATLYEKHVGSSIMNDFLLLDLSPERAKLFGSFIPYVEMLVGVMIVFPKLRRSSAVIACLMHLTIWYSVSGIPSALKQLNQNNLERFYHDINPLHWWQPVWEWNLTLAAASIVFLWNWKTKPVLDYQRSGRRLRATVMLLIISPIVYYGGLIHPYLAHCLFSGNTVRGFVIPREQRTLAALLKAKKDDSALQKLGLPLVPSAVTTKLGMTIPPSDTAQIQYFDRTARNGDLLILYYPDSMKKFTRLVDFERLHGLVNNKEEGYWLLFDVDGKKSSEGTFAEGKKQGKWVEWRPNGQKDAEGQMLDDDQHGSWRYYHDDGLSFDEYHFDHGKQIAAPD